jgi:hypothetical protein
MVSSRLREPLYRSEQRWGLQAAVSTSGNANDAAMKCQRKAWDGMTQGYPSIFSLVLATRVWYYMMGATRLSIHPSDMGGIGCSCNADAAALPCIVPSCEPSGSTAT